MTPETRAALALADAGVPVGAIDRVLGLLDVAVDDNEATIGTKIDDLRSDLPGVFGAVPFGRRPPARPAVHRDSQSAVERGRQRFADGGDLPPAA